MALSETAKLVASLELKDKFSGPANKAIQSLGKLESRAFRAGQQIGKGLSNAAHNVRNIGLVAAAGITLAVKQGLGSLADEVADAVSIPFDELPGWPSATAPGHVGRLLLGTIAGVPVAALQGRFHLYEGNDPGLVVQPVLLFRRLGATLVILTNAAGGVNPTYGPGTLMVISDHLNLTGRTPLLGANADELGPRFPDMTDVWDRSLRSRLHDAARAEGIDLEEGRAVFAHPIRPASGAETARLQASLNPPPVEGLAWYRVVLRQGWKRQVRTAATAARSRSR